MNAHVAGRGAPERVIRVDPDAIRTPQRFHQLVEDLAADPDRPVNLDFGDMDLATSARVRPFHLLVLANVLANDRTDRQISITIPRNDNARLAVMRSGVVFGLIVRDKGSGSLLRGLPADRAEPWVELWRRPWSPHEPALGRLFEDRPREVDSREFAGPGGIIANASNAKRATRVVVAPHLRSREVLYKHCAGMLAGTWLTGITPGTPDVERARRRSTWNKLVTERILREPILNIADHAFTASGTSERRPTRASLVLLARTDGGGEKSHPRLHIVVMDTGYGVVETLRPKLAVSDVATDRTVAATDALDILAHAVERQARTARDPGLPWARTSFCQAVKEVAPDADSGAVAASEFLVISGDPDARHDTIAVTVPPDGQPARERLAGVPFHGTTVFVSLPIPHAAVSDHVNGSLVGAPAAVR